MANSAFVDCVDAMTPDKRPPKEFWIFSENGHADHVAWTKPEHKDAWKYIHVIEHSAYQDLVDTNQTLVSEKQAALDELAYYKDLHDKGAVLVDMTARDKLRKELDAALESLRKTELWKVAARYELESAVKERDEAIQDRDLAETNEVKWAVKMAEANRAREEAFREVQVWKDQAAAEYSKLAHGWAIERTIIDVERKTELTAERAKSQKLVETLKLIENYVRADYGRELHIYNTVQKALAAHKGEWTDASTGECRLTVPSCVKLNLDEQTNPAELEKQKAPVKGPSN